MSVASIEKSRELPPTSGREAGSALVIVLLATIVMVGMTAAMLTMASTGARAMSESLTGVRCAYAAEGALEAALAEVLALEDSGGDGIGALGIDAPVSLLDSTGNPYAEYRAVVTQTDERIEVLAVAAVPSFEVAEAVRSARGFITATPTSILAPAAGAIDVAGPIADPRWRRMGSNDLLIDGGEHAAITFSDADAYAQVAERIADRMAAGHLDGSELMGDELSDYWHDVLGDMELPVGMTTRSFVESAVLDAYRSQLRSALDDLADAADRVVTTSVLGDQVWGTPGAPEVTVIDADAIGAAHVFLTDGQTISGAGTLIIKHWITPEMNLNLDWEGDIFVVGYDADDDDLFKHRGTQGSITGSLVLLAESGTEASVELLDSASRPSDLTVNGNLICLSEELSHEAEIEVEDNSSLTVNGFVGLYGSRIEIEANHPGTTLSIMGTLAIGMAQDLSDDLFRSDDFEFDMRGEVSIRYYESLVGDAIAQLSELETSFGANATTGEAQYSFTVVGASSSSLSGPEALALLEERLTSGQPVSLQVDQLPTTLSAD